MPDLAQWTIQVDSSGLDKAGRGFATIPGKAVAAEKSTDQLAQSFRRLAGPIAGIVSIGALTRTFITINRAFDKLEAGLQTVTGSAKDAAKVMAELTKIGADTPFSVQEVTDAWTMMVNRGLSPTKREFMALGNIAASSKFGILDVVEAVGNAMAGQTENLKKYGIQAITQGDKLSITFQGTTTVVKRSAKEIQDYFTKLGENNFAGAMANRMKTLDGAISNLGDAWEQLWRTIGQTDAGGLVKDSVVALKDALEDLTKFMKSDELARGIKAMRSVFVDFAAAIDKAGGIGATLGKLTAPGAVYESLRQGYNWATGAGPTPREAAAEATRKSLQADLEREYISARILAGTSGGGKVDLGAFGKTGEGTTRPKTEADLAKLRAAFAKRQKELREIEILSDIIAGRYPVKIDEAAIEQAGKDAEERLARVREELRSPMEAIYAEFAEKRDAAKYGPQSVKDKIDEAEKARIDAIFDARQKERDALMDGLRTEEEDIKLSYDRRAEAIEKAGLEIVGTEENRQSMLKKLRDKETEDERQRNLSLIQNSAAAGDALFGNLAEAAKNAGGVQSAAYKRLFALQQTFAIASATASMLTGIGKGLDAGWPAGIPLMIGAAATGAGIISQISSLKYAGAHDAGGFIPAGQFGLVGEKRPELIQGPANVIGGAQTAQIMGGRPNIAVYVAPDANQAMQFARSSHNEQAFLVFTKKHATAIRRILSS